MIWSEDLYRFRKLKGFCAGDTAWRLIDEVYSRSGHRTQCAIKKKKKLNCSKENSLDCAISEP